MPAIPSNAVCVIPKKAPTNWCFSTSPRRRTGATSSRKWCSALPTHQHSVHGRRRTAIGRRHSGNSARRRRQGFAEHSAVENPQLVREAAERFGSQCIVVAIDARRENGGGAKVYTHGGRNRTELDAVEWAKHVAELGAGEILLTSMDADGTKKRLRPGPDAPGCDVRADSGHRLRRRRKSGTSL